MIARKLATLHAQAMTDLSAWDTTAFENLLVSPGVFLVTVPLSNTTEHCGFALGRVVADEAELLTLAVEPKHQGKGFGRACLLAFEQNAARKGAVSAFLEVAATNAPAMGLYLSQGWQKTGLRSAYYKCKNGRIDAILMSKDITRT